MNLDKIIIKNASENNLKSIDLEIPKNKLVIITGVSGSGKSSLAFDVLYNEGRRRYVDSLSNYARQFLGGTSKPDVESIEGLSPSIAIDQKTTSNNPRSTVGTTTEIYDFYRLLFARIGKAYCPNHNIEISSMSTEEILDKVFELWEVDQDYVQILSPIIQRQKGTHATLIKKLKMDGFLRLKIDGEIIKIDDIEKLDKNKVHDISIVIDRIQLNKENKSRMFEAINIASEHSDGLILFENVIKKEEELFSKNLSCKFGDFSIPKIEPRMFSFNSPIGACPVCKGLGFNKQVTWEKLVTEDLTILEGGIKYFGEKLSGMDWTMFSKLLEHYKIPLNKNMKDFSEKEKNLVMYGSEEPIQMNIKSNNREINKLDYIEGLGKMIERRYAETASEMARDYYNKFLGEKVCGTCKGHRLNDKALSIKIKDINIYALTTLSIIDANEWIKELKSTLTKKETEIVKLILNEIETRFSFLINVGLGYLTLDRISKTLSGGESQRIRLASQLGSKLSGVIYVLDEPSIGLHQRDNSKLIESLKSIRDLGNTVVVVEHDEETMLEADYIVDIGPDAGEFGGEVVSFGTPEEVTKAKTHTGRFLSGEDKIKLRSEIRKGNGKEIQVIGARENNLKNVDVTIPLGKMVVISGVSGSGKSTLVNEIIYKTINNSISKISNYDKPGEHDDIKGILNIDKVINVSQDPIGRTPRSNPATYTGVFDNIRDLFANTKEAKIKGYKKGQFSFNVKGGRCEKCNGDGTLKIPMHFLPDVTVTCDLCNGKRYNEEILSIKFKDKNIFDILDMTIHESLDFFKNQKKIYDKLNYLNEVGLGYLKVGHPSTLLSGGESQRVKLATYLQKKPTGKTLYILDEPTTGLHNHDIKKLVGVLDKIVDNGDSMLIIEHNLDVIKIADHLIDMGPEGGKNGGQVVAVGTPKQVSTSKKSETGKYLKYIFKSEEGK